MGDRVILHSDINSCYASIELLHHPELRGKPLAVGGDPEARHGIVLTADYVAKKHGVKTGMALWQARQVCPDITFVPPRMDLYLRFSKMAHEIYGEYTDLQEPYGIDESWLDVTASASIKGDGYKIAHEISNRMKSELGITVSVGVSFNKIFAKLGSDYKKPDAITTMYKDEFQTKAWNLPASDLLYVGRSTDSKLRKMGIRTIGDIARADEKWLNSYLGKMGSILWAFANGYDTSPVRKENLEKEVFETEYGMTGMVKERREAFRDTYIRNNIIGACLCVLAIIPIFAGVIINEENEIFLVFMLCITLVIVGIGVMCFIRVGIIWESFDKLLQKGDYTKEKKTHPVNSLVILVYWLVVTAIYLAVSLPTKNWEEGWIIWVIAVVLFPAVISVTKTISHEK